MFGLDGLGMLSFVLSGAPTTASGNGGTFTATTTFPSEKLIGTTSIGTVGEHISVTLVDVADFVFRLVLDAVVNDAGLVGDPTQMVPPRALAKAATPWRAPTASPGRPTP